MKRRKMYFIASQEKRIGEGVYVSGLSKDNIKHLLSCGVKIDGLKCYIETDISALEEKVMHKDGFFVSSQHSIKFKDYTEYFISSDKTKALLYCDFKNNIRYSVPSYENLKAYTDKFGIENLYFGKHDPDLKTDYSNKVVEKNVENKIEDEINKLIIKSKEEIDSMEWKELKKYLKEQKLHKKYDLRSQEKTRAVLYQDIDNGVYDA